jgi:hypothetical protein
VSEDVHWFIVTYGNKDIGPGSLQQEFQNARSEMETALKKPPG